MDESKKVAALRAKHDDIKRELGDIGSAFDGPDWPPKEEIAKFETKLIPLERQIDELKAATTDGDLPKDIDPSKLEAKLRALRSRIQGGSRRGLSRNQGPG